MLFTLLLIVLSIAADQITKVLADMYLRGMETFPLWENVLHFTYVENRGAAFGMLADHRWVFMILSVLGILAMFLYLVIDKPQSRWIQAALALIIGGGIGNMIDRVRLGYVIDFIDCRFIDFYVFNVADSCVCVGCAIFIVKLLWDEVQAKKEKKAGETEHDA